MQEMERRLARVKRAQLDLTTEEDQGDRGGGLQVRDLPKKLDD